MYGCAFMESCGSVEFISNVGLHHLNSGSGEKGLAAALPPPSPVSSAPATGATIPYSAAQEPTKGSSSALVKL